MKNSPMPLTQRVRRKSFLIACGILIGLVSLLFSSCRKKDDEPPILSINLLGSSSFQFGENISFSVSATDNEQLSSLTVLIQASNGSTVLESRSYDLQNSSNYGVQDEIEHNGRYLESGYYLLKAIANDGENESIAFREIYLYELPTEILRYFILQTIDVGNTRVDSVQLNGSSFLAANIPMGLDNAQSNPLDGSLLLGGREFEGLSAFDGLQLTMLNTLGTPSNTSPDYFTEIVYDENSFTHYVLSGDGFIRNVRGDASVKKTIQTLPFIPEHVYITDDYLIVLEHNLLETENRISVYNKATGTYLQSVELDFEPKVILDDTNADQEYWLLGNQNGQTISRKFSLSNNQVFDPNGILEIGEASPVLTAILLPDGRPLISHENGTYVYNSTFTGSGIFVESAASQLKYEPLENAIWIVQNGIVKVVQNGSFATLQTYSILPGHALVTILYNK